MLSDLHPQHSSLSSLLQNISGWYNTVLGGEQSLFRICEPYVIEMGCNRWACHKFCLLDRRSVGLCVWYTSGCSCEPPTSLNTHPGACTQSFVFMLCKLTFLTSPMRSVKMWTLQWGGVVPGLTGCAPPPPWEGPFSGVQLQHGEWSHLFALMLKFCVLLQLYQVFCQTDYIYRACNPFSLEYRYRYFYTHICCHIRFWDMLLHKFTFFWIPVGKSPGTKPRNKQQIL